MELARILDELEIRKTSFSKYGRGYMEYMYGQTNEMAMNGISPKEMEDNIVSFRKAV